MLVKRIRILALALLFVVAAALPAWAAPNVTMTTRAANEGRVKPNSWTTVVVELSNQGAELSGELTVKTILPEGAGGGWERFPEYVIPVSLPAGAKKKVPVDVPVQNWNRVQVSLRSGGALVQEETITLTLLPGDASLIGVLSGDELGIPALSKVGQAATTHVVRLDADTLPARAALMEHYDILAISRFDSGTLSKEQAQALEAWVGKGGTLLLTGGPEWRRTFAGLPKSLVPVEVTSVGNVDMAPLGALIGKPLQGSGPVSQGRLLSGQALITSGDTVLLSQTRVGAGKVVYLAGDPGLDPLATWAGQGDLYVRYLATGKAIPMDFGDSDMMMAGALQRIPGLGLPALSTVALLLIGYLLLVGPANYLLLKRLDRREWGWVSVPLISVLFVGAVYGLSIGRRTPLLSHLITVTELAPGTGAATMKSYVGLYAPSQNDLSVSLENAHLVKPITYGGAPDSGPTGRVRAGDKTTVELFGFNNYTMKGFSMEQDVATAGFELVNVTYANGTLTGSVVNKLGQPLKEARIVLGMQQAMLGDLGPGEKSKPFELPFSAGDPMNPKMRVGMAFVQEGPWSEDVMRREQIWSSTFRYGQYQAAPGTVVVGGWTDAPVGQVALPELGRMHQGGNLVWGELPIPFDASAGDIPPGLFTAVATSGPVARSPFGYQMQPATYSFSLQLPPLDPAKVAEVYLHVNTEGPALKDVATLSVLNRKTGAWVALEGTNMQSLQGWQDFIARDGLMELRLEARAHFGMMPPTVSVKGVGR